MARTALALQVPVRAGLTPSFTAANVDGHSIANDGHTCIEVKNASGSPINVTFPIPVLVDGQAVTSLVVSIPATTGDKIIGPFPPATYNQADGKLYVDFSAVTSVNCAAIQVS